MDHQNWASPIYISDPGMVMRPKTGAKPALPQKPCFENGPGYQPTEGPVPPEGGPGPPRKSQGRINLYFFAIIPKINNEVVRNKIVMAGNCKIVQIFLVQFPS